PFESLSPKSLSKSSVDILDPQIAQRSMQKPSANSRAFMDASGGGVWYLQCNGNSYDMQLQVAWFGSGGWVCIFGRLAASAGGGVIACGTGCSINSDLHLGLDRAVGLASAGRASAGVISAV
ncbi:hypothetical protein U1Q18_008303, partial [Sarracenia purpurea var. burkii]